MNANLPKNQSKMIRVLGFILFALTFVGISGCAQPTTTVYSPTTTTSPIIASIQGQIHFVDGTPGYNVQVMLRNENNLGGYPPQALYAHADSQGYYRFYNIDPGTYWLNTITNNSYITNEPSAIVTVNSGVTSEVDNLTVQKDIFIISINDAKERYSRITVSGHSFTFTWTAVDGATSYDAEIWSTSPSNRDYDLTIRTTTNTLTWPLDLSTLPYSDFRIDLTAYNQNNMILAQNFQLFSITKQ